ncbi:MAG: M48 family metalloprotease [Pyrinomonadaceae bacterium]
MTHRSIRNRLAAAMVAVALWGMPLAAVAQLTQIRIPNNKYRVQDDVKLGNDASREVERQFPILNDDDAASYVASVGGRLVASIPPQFRQPAFDYRFKVVNARDLNAFALPGGPMYINRGMIEAARNEGEMAGVMAHEISHVALRHATAQATKQGGAGNTLRTLGLILGGAVLGGQTGAQLGAGLASVWTTKYSREYETQADTLGVQIMANAGYDPRDLANVFQTIARQGGGSGPEWLSSHPDPGNRYQKINREAAYLRVENPIKITRDFERVKARLSGMPPARSMAEIERGYGGDQRTNNPAASGRYSNNVPAPSTRYRNYSDVSWLRLSVPSNWREFSSQTEVQFAPEGAYGDQGITRGVMVGLYRPQSYDLQSATETYVNQVMQGNSYLSRRSGLTRTSLGGRTALATVLAGRSPITGRSEVVTIYTTQLRSGYLFHAITVVPNDESFEYNAAFRNVIGSIQFND